jgi:heme/copper-type cytochrome/quinol oxidase subunit 3
MSVDLDAEVAGLDRNPVDRRSTGYWGTVLLVATEATLFAALLASYFYLRLNTTSFRPPGVEPPELLLALPNTIILVASSGVMWWAERSARRDAWGRARLATAIVTVMGVAFVVIQGFEYSRKHYGVADHAYATATYTITGLHTAHVVVGVLLLAFVVWRTGREDRGRHAALQNVALYWHFVDVVWIAVFTSLYLSERW